MLLFQPMPLQKCPLPFSSADWIFELKYDGFRAPVVGLRPHPKARLCRIDREDDYRPGNVHWKSKSPHMTGGLWEFRATCRFLLVPLWLALWTEIQSVVAQPERLVAGRGPEEKSGPRFFFIRNRCAALETHTEQGVEGRMAWPGLRCTGWHVDIRKWRA